MINVYSANETNFNHNGLATLNPLSAELSADVNGSWVLTLVLPWDKEKKYTYVEKNNIIIADIDCIREQASPRQKFRIYDYRKNYTTLTVKACPVAFEATYDVPITDLKIVAENGGDVSGVDAIGLIQNYIVNVIGNTKYTLSSNVAKMARADYINSNLIKILGSSDANSYINLWGGEIAYDNYAIKIRTFLGDQDNAGAYLIKYGKNITGVEYGLDVSNAVTRIFPISSDGMRLNKWDDLTPSEVSTQQYVDGNTSAYPYIKSAFFTIARAKLIDTTTDSISETRTHTIGWQNGITNTVREAVKPVWQAVNENENQEFSPQYVQEIIPEIIEYIQARFTFTHKGWQAFVKSCIKSGIEWIKDEEIPEWGWKGEAGAWWYGANSYVFAHSQYVLINKVFEWFNQEGFWEDWWRFTDAEWHQEKDGKWWYGDKTEGGATKNYAKNQYIYIWAESKWYQFDEDGYYIDEEIPAETIALLNTYSWRQDSTGWYYGDGNGNYLTNSWVENEDGSHNYVDSNGYLDETKDDEQEWLWFTEPAKMRYGDYSRYYAHNEYVYVKVDGQWKEWFYDKEGWYDADKSGDSDYDWHGSGTSGDPYWFGTEEDGERENYIANKWAFIDGTYYWFDEYGYVNEDFKKPDYQWGVQTDTTTGNTWFGNTDKTYEAIYISNQWLKIDGEWYYFDQDGYKVDMDKVKNDIIAWFGGAVYNDIYQYINNSLQEAYTYLYADMTAWCNEQYALGIDSPNVSVDVNLVDLSKTSEYQDYVALERIYLGDKVEVEALGMKFTERVVGLTYDIIRGYNTRVTIGKFGETISSIMSTNMQAKETGGGETIIAGDGIHKDGNVISVDNGNNGTSYGIQDVIFEGTSLVSGNVAVLDEVIPEVIDVVANPEAEATDDLIKLQVDGVVYQLRGGGLQYWNETSDQIYREYEVEGISVGVDGYLFTDATWFQNEGQSYYRAFQFRKANNLPAIIGVGGYDSAKHFYLLSTNPDAVKWEYRCTYVSQEWFEPANTGAGGGDASRTQELFTLEYDGVTWYGSHGTMESWTSYPTRFQDISGWRYNQSASYWANILLTQCLASPTTTVKVGLGKDDKILYQKVGENYVAYLDDTGAYEGTDYKVNGESLITKINAKQDKLIQGTNITIGADGKTISATDTDEVSELTDVELTDLADGQVLKWDATNEKWVNAEESGGSEVIANPSGTATDTLSKVSIDGTVYEIEGSSGEGYTEDVLWDTGGTTSSWASPLVITLNENISDYDAIRISFTDVDGNDGFVFIPTSEIPSNYADKYFVGAGDFLATVNVNSDTQISCYAKNGITMTYNNVIGISYGSGGSGGGAKVIEELWSGAETPTTSGTQINLSHNISNYDIIVFSITQNNGYGSEVIFSVDSLSVGNTYIGDGYAPNELCTMFEYTTDNSIKIKSTASARRVTYTRILGIKFGGSGGGGSSEINYSTEEQRIGTWIDGKPIYQKTFEKQVTNVSATGSVDITSEIPITCTIKDSTVAFDYNYGGVEYALVNSPNVYYNRGGNANYIRFAIGSGTLSGNITMIAVYTKTTD